MELNQDQMNYLEFIRENTDARGYALTSLFSPMGRAICAHLLQRGFIGFNFESDGYYINSSGRREIDKALNPPVPAAVLRADIAALEAQIAVKRAALAALGDESQPAVDKGGE